MKGSVRRRSSLSANLKIGERARAEGDDRSFLFAQAGSVKPWRSTQDLEERAREQPGAPSAFARASPGLLILNVGGVVFQLDSSAAARYPRTRIGRLVACTDLNGKLGLCDDFSFERSEYFFDRDPMVFRYVARFYCSGVLWVMDELCPTSFMEEIEYWGIPLSYSHSCCHSLFEEHQDELEEHRKVQRELQAELEPLAQEEHFEGKWFSELRKKIWNLVENPRSSAPARVVAILSSIFVLVSIVAMCLSTVEELQQLRVSGKSCMEHVEGLCVAFFTAEYLVRLLSAPDPKRFLKTALNFVDLVAILPFYVQMVFEHFLEEVDLHLRHNDIEKMERVGQLGKVLKTVRLLRVLRILKLARHSTGLRAFGFTLRQCYQQVFCLFLFIAMGIFAFSSLMHSVEHDHPGSHFSSIPETWWWAAVSISTVGYGDNVPETVLGRVVAFLCISFGIILNGMPISILYNRFSDFYAKLKAQEAPAAQQPGAGIRLRKQLRRRLGECWSGRARGARPGKPQAGAASPAEP
ncbi:potassium voltage-gated channel subfamily V member 2-like [Rhinatrema bivittatum]|uniref:potassium voltage-gated channel subfamily V member 2-like n=1 Tax=Rhinatrema bivittatum TaxID=194408 RepID=UPI00112920FE|nr:potassium voltage-gated channel subfamily V member 2-like [Rhinatrema bivittatum]